MLLLQSFVSKYVCLWGRKLKWLSWQDHCNCVSQRIKSTFEKGQHVITLALKRMANLYVQYMDDAFITSL